METLIYIVKASKPKSWMFLLKTQVSFMNQSANVFGDSTIYKASCFWNNTYIETCFEIVKEVQYKNSLFKVNGWSGKDMVNK